MKILILIWISQFFLIGCNSLSVSEKKSYIKKSESCLDLIAMEIVKLQQKHYINPTKPFIVLDKDMREDFVVTCIPEYLTI